MSTNNKECKLFNSALHCSSHQLNLCPDHAFLYSQSRDQTIKYFQLNQRSQDLWKYLNSNNGWWYRCIVNHLIQDLKYKTVLISIDFESINLAQVEPALSFVSGVFVLFIPAIHYQQSTIVHLWSWIQVIAIIQLLLEPCIWVGIRQGISM